MLSDIFCFGGNMENYIYKFINYDNEIIYIGKTGNIQKRMRQHFGPDHHLPDECYEQVYQIFYANVGSQFNAELLETYFINKYHPRYNTDKNYRVNVKDINLSLSDPIWLELHFEKILTPSGNPGILFHDCAVPYLSSQMRPAEQYMIAADMNINKLQAGMYEIRKFAPGLIKSEEERQELIGLYRYIKEHADIMDSDLDEHLTGDKETQFSDTILAFSVETGNDLPGYFWKWLKNGWIRYAYRNVFYLPMICRNVLEMWQVMQ